MHVKKRLTKAIKNKFKLNKIRPVYRKHSAGVSRLEAHSWIYPFFNLQPIAKSVISMEIALQALNKVDFRFNHKFD